MTASRLIAAIAAAVLFASPRSPPREQGGAAKKAEAKKDEREERRSQGRQLQGASTFRGIGPAMISGRITDLAVDPRNNAIRYVTAASGNVWKTINAGTTWTPIFDDQGSYSIGCIALDPKNPADASGSARGENNSQRSVSYGDGVYRSIDGGVSWENLGLKGSEHIAKILIDPRDSNRVLVAAQGPLWAPGGDRGLYETQDGGKTWKAILTVDENTGVTDVVRDPRDPDVLYAATYQRRRHIWTLIDGGPGSGIWKTHGRRRDLEEARKRAAEGRHGADRARDRAVEARHRLRDRRGREQGRRLLPLDRPGGLVGEARPLRRGLAAVLQRAVRRSARSKRASTRWTPGCR